MLISEAKEDFLIYVILQKLMINEILDTVAKLQKALIVTEVYVSALPKDTPYKDFEHKYVFPLYTF